MPYEPYSFIKKAALSTDYETFRNSSMFHPRVWLSNAQSKLNSLLSPNQHDSKLKSLSKSLGRFIGDDVVLSTLKNVVGAAETPIRLGLSAYDTFLGKIAPKEFGARSLDAANDVLWTGIGAVSGGALNAGAKGLGRSVLRRIPGTRLNAFSKHLKPMEDSMIKSLKSAKNNDEIKRILSSNFNYLDKFFNKTNKLDDKYKQYFYARLLNRIGSDKLRAPIRQIISDKKLLSSTDPVVSSYATKAGRYGLRDVLENKNSYTGKLNFLSGLNRAMSDSGWAKFVAASYLPGMIAMVPGIQDTKIGKLMAYPGDLLTDAYAYPQRWSEKNMVSIPKSYVDTFSHKYNLSPKLRNTFFKKNYRDYNAYTLNKNAIDQLSNDISELLGIKKGDVYDYILRMLSPYSGNRKPTPWYWLSRGLEQGINGIYGAPTRLKSSPSEIKEFIDSLNT